MVLRIDETTHHRVNSTTPLDQYTTNDQIVSLPFAILIASFLTHFQVFDAHISSYDPKTATWTPYSGLKDLQLEFTMLDPHIRTALLPVKGQPGKYSVTFRAPDRHGVYKFVINHKRKGYGPFQSTHILKLTWCWLVSRTSKARLP
jgi:oligosaccharyltransferase complex subunit beta